MYDLIIIGAGAAGISASLYAKRANLNVMVLHYGKSSVEKAERIENYYGFEQGITGKRLYIRGINQAKNLGINVKKEEVVQITQTEKEFSIKTVKNQYNTKAVIIATGGKKIKPNIPGIEEFEGKGISYCAICDAFFYRNKNVVIIGEGEFALSEAKELKNVTENITILSNGKNIVNTDINNNSKEIKRIEGDTRVRQIIFKDGSNMFVDGVFIALGEAGSGDFAKTLGIILENDKIKVNSNMETNVKGVYACGDAVGGLLQISKSVYEGTIAGLSAVSYCKQ